MTAGVMGLVSAGAAVGAVARYRVGRFVTQRVTSDFPWGTWVINVLGTLLLGIFYQELDVLHADASAWALLGTGFCGAFTTFSTMSVEAIALFRRRPSMCIAYVGSSLLVGMALAWITQWV
ncbi:MAG: CrcB family protein [Alicyclobacillus sp.]|nr:CrcB family protein [Alicyclobacillus sp.]